MNGSKFGRVAIILFSTLVINCKTMTVGNTTGLDNMISKKHTVIRNHQAFVKYKAKIKGYDENLEYEKVCDLNNAFIEQEIKNVSVSNKFEIPEKRYDIKTCSAAEVSEDNPCKVAIMYINRTDEAINKAKPMKMSIVIDPINTGKTAAEILKVIMEQNDKDVEAARSRIIAALKDSAWNCSTKPKK